MKLIVLIGPTAVGKTGLSLHLAQRFSCEIINMDSMQIYRYMDIGTAKPSQEERSQVPHHLLDFVDPAEKYNLSRYINDATEVMDTIAGRHKIPMLVGGTGLYLKGLLEGIFEIPAINKEIKEQVRQQAREKGRAGLYEELLKVDPSSAARIHPNDTQRICRAVEIFRSTSVPWSVHLRRQQKQADKNRANFEPLKIGLSRKREILYERINERTQIMIRQGLLQEVEKLLAMGYSPELNAMQSIGYRHMINFLTGKWSWEQAMDLLARDTRRYAKRQYTWFRRDPKIHWFEPNLEDEICDVIERFME